DDRNAAVVEAVGDRQRAVAADDDQRIESHLVEHLDDAIRVVANAFRSGDRVRERVAAVGGAENRSTKTQDAGHVPGRQSPRSPRFDEPVEAVFEADALDARVRCALDDGANDGVEARRVAAAGEDTKARECGHVAMECNRARALRPLKRAWYNRRSISGRLAQLGERRVRNAEVGSSSLLPSTKMFSKRGSFGCLFFLYRALWTNCGQIERVQRRDSP